jgi:eukaryotic-like serine/threonine-protein kinase
MSHPSEHTSLPEGTVVAGKLRVVRVLGVGGMGTVYEVEHDLTKHRRALKILHARAARDPSAAARFLREASAAARIGNAHIAETFDAGNLDTGEPYLLMELLEGETLDERLKRLGPLDPGELAEIVHQACDGVQAAHDVGIVHRDLKPENLFVTVRDGLLFTKVVDFGISKFDSKRTGSLGVTTEGVLIGTPYYMSPEQVRGEAAVDARADVYALGVILYECACGVRPYDAQAVEHLAVLIHEGKAVPLSERRPSLSPAFCAVVERAMAVDRERRFGSARELAEALQPMRVTPGPAAVASLSSHPPKRVVIRPSSRPPPGSNLVTTAAPTSSSMPAALADTMASDFPPPPGRRSHGWRPIALTGLLVAGVGIAAALEWIARAPAHAPISPAAATSAPPEPSSVAVLPPPAPPVVSVRAPEEATATVAPARSTAPSARPSASGAAPAPPATPKSRVDQNGLAGENPFR